MKVLWNNQRGSVSLFEGLIALLLLIPVAFLIIDLFAGMEQYHLARSLKNQYKMLIKVDGQLTNENVIKLIEDADKCGFIIKSLEIKRSDGTLVSGNKQDAVVQNTVDFVKSRLDITIVFQPKVAPWAFGKAVGEENGGVYVIPLKDVTWSDLDKLRDG